MSAVTDFRPGETCPCGCGITGNKLSFKTGHIVRVCGCHSCRNSRSVKKGKRAQAKGHRALGGIGFTPSNEETHNGYDVRVQVEHKHGYPDQTVMLRRFIQTEFFRHALSQAQRAQRIGDGSHPGMMLDGRWLLVDCKSTSPVREEP